MLNTILTKEQFYDRAFAYWLRTGIMYNYRDYLLFWIRELKNFNPKLYIWRTQKDEKVRDSHSDKDGKIFNWDSDDLKPGEDFGCRCYAEFVDDNLEPVGECGRIGYLDQGQKDIDGKIKWKAVEVVSEDSELLNEEQEKLQVLEDFIRSEELRENIREAEKQNVWLHPLRTWNWFTGKVTNNNEWNYKKKLRHGEHVGNFNYGATGRAILRKMNRNFVENLLLRGGGYKQEQDGTSQEEWGDYRDLTLTNSFYGDDPRDQEMIKQGINWYDQNYGE